jgi:hypothetical protein
MVEAYEGFDRLSHRAAGWSTIAEPGEGWPDCPALASTGSASVVAFNDP